MSMCRSRKLRRSPWKCGLDESWRIGLIAGLRVPANQYARAAFGESLLWQEWPSDAVIDCLTPIKQLTFLLTSVGFGSPPAWLRPYDVLRRRALVATSPGRSAR
jgi:hypothetical protein